MQFMVDILQVLLDGIYGHTAFIGDHFVGIAFHEQFKDYGFPGGKIILRGSWSGLTKKLKDLLRHKRTHGHAPAHHFLQGADQL